MSDRDDSDLHDYLDGGSQLSRAYQALEKIEPPGRLDDQVRKHARDVLAREQPGKGTAWLPRWRFVWGTIITSAILTFLLVSPERHVRREVQIFDETAIRSRSPADATLRVLSEPEAAQERLEATLERNLKPKPEPDIGPPARSDDDSTSPLPRDPAEWLDEIAALNRQGHVAAARRELKAFRERYPDYPLPPGIESR